MKIWVVGDKGQLGLELVKQLSKQSDKYIIIHTGIDDVDITEQEKVLEFVNIEKPDVVINTAAYTNVDRCEQEEYKAFKVNAIGAQNLSVGAYKVGAKIVQISTDYVFDGKGHIPKKEFDSINPESCYGMSKALGEKLVRETNPKHYIIRTAWLYGEGNNFVRTMLRLAKEKEEISVVNDQTGTPTSVVDLATCIIKLLETESYGTYHGTCEGYCTWYDLAKKIFEIKKINIRVKEITTEELNRPATRPKYSVLENYMLKILELNTFRHWEEALKEYLEGEVVECVRSMGTNRI